MPQVPDIDRLIAEVAARHGILLKKDDAAFALVTLNELVLESAIADLVAGMRAATTEFEKAMERVQERAGVAMAKQTRTILRELTSGLASTTPLPCTVPQQEPSASQWSRVGLFAAGLVVGWALSWIWRSL